MNLMKDVTPSPKSNSNYDQFSEEFRGNLLYIFNYIKNPIHEITRLPNWNWLHLIILLYGISFISGLCAGFLPPNPYRILSGIILFPIMALVMNGLTSLFIYYFFQVFKGMTHSFRKVFTLVFFANIPFYLFEMGSEMLPPITLIGFAFTAFILIVGLVANFSLEKKIAIRLVGGVYTVILLLWIYNRISA